MLSEWRITPRTLQRWSYLWCAVKMFDTNPIWHKLAGVEPAMGVPGRDPEHRRPGWSNAR
jgi:hypothetical protein